MTLSVKRETTDPVRKPTDPVRLWFVMPVHGREALTRICLRQLRRTCDALEHASDIQATAVAIGDDENLDTARDLGFATVRRENHGGLGAKFNDGLELACNPAYNPEPADYAVPIGSDDWIDYTILLQPPPEDTVLGFRQIAFVDETGRQLSETTLGYDAGSGIRVYPRELLALTDYRPAEEDRRRGCDTSILYNTRHEYHHAHGGRLPIAYGDQHARQIVDWKSPTAQLNTFNAVATRHPTEPVGDPFEVLQGLYPAEALDEMEHHYRP